MLDDARLFLLDGSCTCEEKASTLASVGLISSQGKGSSGSGSGDLHRGGLLSMYLEGVDVQLDSAIEGLSHKQSSQLLTGDCSHRVVYDSGVRGCPYFVRYWCNVVVVC